MGMVACVKEEVTLLPQGDAILFENAFIDNSTRAADPSITTATLTGFNVWGFVKEYDGEIFNDVEVTRNNDSSWSYSGTQYWVPNQPYYFAALAPMNSANWSVVKATGDAAKKGLGVISFENKNGTEDLLYAKETMMSKSLNVANGSVKFQFQHLLSKVKFTFKNGFPTATASIKVTNVKMVVPASAEINLAQADYSEAWTSHAGTLILEFGDVEELAYTQSAEVANERLTIPASAAQSYIITFDVELFMGAQSVYTLTMTSVVSGSKLKMGNAYNFAAEINPTNLELEEIVFDVEKVEDWDSQGGPNVDMEVAVAKLKSAATHGGTYTLDDDIILTEPLAVEGDLNINLNGKKLQYTEDDRMFKVYGVTLTIEGDGVVEVNSDNLNASTTAAYIGTAYDGAKIIINGGVHKTNGCTAYHANGGKVEINGGDIIADETGYNPAAKYGYKYVLNVQGGTVSNARNFIEVKGGRFYKFNPQNNAAEGTGTNFVADGYIAAQDGDYYVVSHE